MASLIEVVRKLTFIDDPKLYLWDQYMKSRYLFMDKMSCLA